MAKIQLDPEELDHLLGTPSGPSILPNGPGPVPMAPLTRKPLANQPVPSITGMNLGAPPAPPRSITDNPLGPMNPATPLERPRPAESRLEALEQKGPGINSFSQRHHILGPIVKGLETAGTILAPGAMAAIPGTRMNYRANVLEAENEANEEGKQAQERATTGAEQARTEQETAEAERARAQAQAALNPPEKEGLTPEETTIHDLMTGNNGQPRINPDTNKPYSYLEAYQSVKQAGQKPAAENTEDKAISDWLGANNLPNTPANRNKARLSLKAEERPPKEPNEQEQSIRDWLEASNLPNTPANRVQARKAILEGQVNARGEATANSKQDELKKGASQALKNMNALMKQDTPASNYAFLMNFIGMSYEGVRGARLNRAEIERAAMTRALPDALQNSYDLWVQRKQLTPQQKQEMLKTAEAIAGTYSETNASGTVNMKSPNGQIKPVPADQVDHYKALGATVVNQ